MPTVVREPKPVKACHLDLILNDQGGYLYDPGNLSVKMLNATAASLVCLADGTRTVHQLAKALAAKFSDVPFDIIEKDVKNFTAYLLEQGCLRNAPEPALEYLILYVTTACNMRCQHCWVSGGHSSTGEVTGEELLQVLNEARMAGLDRINITGGEPLLRGDLVLEVLDKAQELCLRTTLETNGTLLNEDYVHELGHRRVGTVSVSLDFPDHQRFDRFRGMNGGFARVVHAFGLLVSHGIPAVGLMTVTKENLPVIEDVAELVLGRLGVNKLKIQPCNAIGRAREMHNELLGPDQILELIGVMRKLAATYSGRIESLIGRAFSGTGKDGIEAGACRFRNMLSICPNGDISICGLALTRPEVVLGNIRTHNLLEVWQSAELLKCLRTLSPDTVMGVCSICRFRASCANVCPANAFEAYETFLGPSPLCQQLYEACFLTSI